MKFLSYVPKLEMIEAIGIARLLGVELMVDTWSTGVDIRETEIEEVPVTASEDSNTGEASINLPGLVRNQQNMDQKFKDFNTLLSEMLDAFIAAPEQKRKWILQMMKDATQGVK